MAYLLGSETRDSRTETPTLSLVAGLVAFKIEFHDCIAVALGVL